MPGSILPPEPDGSELERWADEGTRREPHHSNVVIYISPDERYHLTVALDDPIRGYLIRLSIADEDEQRIGQTVVDERDLAVTVTAEMAAAADDLAAVDDRPQLGPETIHAEDLDDEMAGRPDTPEDWGDDEAWHEALKDAWEEADIPRGKGSLTTKTIDGREYYYLQWREGDTVTSQYVAPASPTS